MEKALRIIGLMILYFVFMHHFKLDITGSEAALIGASIGLIS